MCAALHSSQRAGAALGEVGAHGGGQPLPAPRLTVPGTPTCAGDTGFKEDSGRPTPPSGQVRDSFSFLPPPPPPLRTRWGKHTPRVPTGPLPTSTRAHRAPSPPAVSMPRLPSANPNMWARSPSRVICQMPASSPGSRLREVKRLPASHSICHMLPRRLQGVSSDSSLAPAGPGWLIRQGPSVFTRRACGRLCSLPAGPVFCLVHVLRAPERVGALGPSDLRMGWEPGAAGEGPGGPRSREDVTGLLPDQGRSINGWVGTSK